MISRSTSTASVNPMHLAFGEHAWAASHTPHPEVVVLIIGVVVVTVGGAGIVLVVVPAPPAQHLE